MKIELSGQILKNTLIFTKIRPVGVVQTDGRTDRWTNVTKLIVAFRNLAITLKMKNVLYLNLESFFCI